MNLDEIRTHLQNAKDAMARSPSDTLVQQGYVRNLFALAEAELKIHELNKTDTATSKLVEIVTTLGTTVKTLENASKNAETASQIQAKQTNAMIFWTVVLAVATALMAYYAHQQIKEGQNLTKVSQEQVDLQLQPALMVDMQLGGGPTRDLYLVNIGNGAAINIKFSSNDNKNAFILPTQLLDSKQRLEIYIVKNPVDKNNLTGKEINNQLDTVYYFENNTPLILYISYTNIKNKPYFSKIKISKLKVELISMGEGSQ